jgi:hypothetical protein
LTLLLLQNRGSQGEGIWVCDVENRLPGMEVTGSTLLHLIEAVDNHHETRTLADFMSFCEPVRGLCVACVVWGALMSRRSVSSSTELRGPGFVITTLLSPSEHPYGRVCGMAFSMCVCVCVCVFRVCGVCRVCRVGCIDEQTLASKLNRTERPRLRDNNSSFPF